MVEVRDEELFRALRSAQPREAERIREILVTRHDRLVRWTVGRYALPAVDRGELLQVGYLGLVLAIERFDVDRGIDFGSYAVPTVQGEIRRWFRDKRRWVRLPRKLQETKARLQVEGELLTHRLHRAPLPRELAAHCGIPEELVMQALAAEDNFPPASLDASVGQDVDEDLKLADVLGVEDSAIDLTIDCAVLRPLLEQLDEFERRLLRMHCYHELPQSRIAVELGCSQTQVSRLLKRILTDLRHQLPAESA
ncbi:MAG TPA: sigma-70 family RNA polymerase sigma factor [Sporichthyaceae bacterium]|nr:sigma-70 family RNA polymerase sigma factor [Sporichthyaceae bacterium]